MPVHPPSVLLALAVALSIATIASASNGLRQRARRGTGWWIGADAMLVLALGVQAGSIDPSGISAPIASLLALQWPIVMLIGTRRFFARGATGIPTWVDAVAFAVATLATVGTWIAPLELAPSAYVFAVATLALTLYVAAVVWRLEDFATTATLRKLVGGLLIAAIAQAGWLAFGIVFHYDAQIPADAGLGAPVALTALALLMTQLTLVMNHERNIAHMRTSQRKLRQLVDVDELTQLPNRRHFHELAGKAVKALPEAATVLVFDVDRLQRINELIGHASGDEALRQIGTALRETLRRRDVAGRLGGDEFAAVLPRTKVADAAAVVARINACINDRQVAPRIARVSLNVGSTQMQAGETIADALRRAEIALQVARDEKRQKAAAGGDAVEPANDPVAKPTTMPGLLAAQSRPSQAAALNAIPVGEVVFGGGQH